MHVKKINVPGLPYSIEPLSCCSLKDRAFGIGE